MAFNSFLDTQCNFSPILECTNVNMAAAGLNYHINRCYDLFFPIKTIKCHTNYLFKPSKELLDGIKRKRVLYRKFKKHNIKHQQIGQTNCSKCVNLWDEYKNTKTM